MKPELKAAVAVVALVFIIFFSSEMFDMMSQKNTAYVVLGGLGLLTLGIAVSAIVRNHITKTINKEEETSK